MFDGTSELDDLKRRLDDIESRIEIANRMASYGPLVDANLPAETAELWTADGVYDAELDTFEGRDGIVGMVNGALHQKLLASGGGHFVGVPYIEVRGGHATAITHALLLVQRREEDDFKVWRVTATRWEWKKIDKTWHVSARVNRKLDGSESARSIFEGVLRRVESFEALTLQRAMPLD
jgi:hypothetical protein